MTIRATITAPKSVTGLLSIGWFPYSRVQYSNNPATTFAGETTAMLASGPLQKQILNRLDTQLLSLGEPADVILEIPWTYAFPYIPIEYIFNLPTWKSVVNERPETGEPILVTSVWAIQSQVPLVTPKVDMLYTVTYEDLKFFGRVSTDVPAPKSVDDFELQMNSVGGAIAGVAVDAATKKANELLKNTFDDWYDTLVDKAEDVVCSTTGVCLDLNNNAAPEQPAESAPEHSGSNFATPLMTMSNVIGDTLSAIPPCAISLRGTRPSSSRSPHISHGNVPISHFLNRPQLIYQGTYNGTTSYNSLEVIPVEFDSMPQFPTWFGYFAQISRYWRGSLRYHFVFAGHPLIEQRFAIAYSPYARRDLDAFSFTSTPYFENFTGNFSGSKTISVLIPYVHQQEYLALDKNTDMNMETRSTGKLRWELTVTNTAFDAITSMSYMVFISAGPDFAFYDPTPPGFYNVTNPALKRDAPLTTHGPLVMGTPPKGKLQCGLPGLPDPVTLMDRYQTRDPGIFKPLKSLKQLASYWSRTLSSPVTAFRFPRPVSVGTPYVGSTWPANDIFSYGDYVAYSSAMFLYWRGEIGIKTVFNPAYTVGDHNTYAWVTVGDPHTTVNTYSTVHEYTTAAPTSRANWGAGTIITKVDEQPVLEFTIPMRHNMGVSFVNYTDSVLANNWSRYGYIDPAPIYTNILSTATISTVPTEVDLVYRKIGRSFDLYVESLLPPPANWASRGFAQI